MGHDASNLVLKAVGGNIRALRKAENVTQEKFAAMIGIQRTYLSQIERGNANPSFKRIVEIADGLDVPLEALVFGLNGKAPSKLSPEAVYAVVKIPKDNKKKKGSKPKRRKR